MLVYYLCFGSKEFLKVKNEKLINVNPYWIFQKCMKDCFFCAHILVRMIAIDCYYKKNDYGWEWYNEMQIKRVNDNPLIPKHMADHEEEFKELIRSFEENGFIEKNPIVVNEKYMLLDGAHRLALALYMGLNNITMVIDKKYNDFEMKDYSFDWFKKHEMGYVQEEAMKKYNEIKKKYEVNL